MVPRPAGDQEKVQVEQRGTGATAAAGRTRGQREGAGLLSPRSPAEPKLNSRLATGAARRSNGREEPIRMSGANHFRAGGGVGGGMLTSPSSAHQDLRSGGGLGTVRYPCLTRVRRTAPKRSLCGSSRGAGSPERHWAWPFLARVRAVSLSTTLTGRARDSPRVGSR